MQRPLDPGHDRLRHPAAHPRDPSVSDDETDAWPAGPGYMLAIGVGAGAWIGLLLGWPVLPQILARLWS